VTELTETYTTVRRACRFGTQTLATTLALRCRSSGVNPRNYHAWWQPRSDRTLLLHDAAQQQLFRTRTSSKSPGTVPRWRRETCVLHTRFGAERRIAISLAPRAV